MKKKKLKMVLLILLSSNFLSLLGQTTCLYLTNGTEECHTITSISTIKFENGNIDIQFSDQNDISYPLQEIRKMTFRSDTILQMLPFQTNRLRIYPNPVSDILTIETPEQFRGLGFIEIYSMDGRNIQTFRSTQVNATTQINVSSLSQGVYICRIRNGNQTSSIQFVNQ